MTRHSRARLPGAHRIAYLMTDHPRLSQTFVAQEIDELRANGWDIVPISLNDPDLGADASPEVVAEAARTFYVKQAGPLAVARAGARLLSRRPRETAGFVVGAMRGLGFDLRAMLWRFFQCGMAMVVREECRRRGVVHVHAQFGGPSATLAWLTHLLDEAVDDGSLTWSYTVHGYHEFTEESRNQLASKTRSAAFTVCISDHQRAQLLRIAGVNVRDRVHVIRVGIDLHRFTTRPPTPLHDPPRLLTVGRIAVEKGMFVLLEAVAQLRAGGRIVLLDLVGDGPLRDELEAYARSRGIDDQVHVLGMRPPGEVVKRLRDTDVFCLPSFAEGIPVSIMEAMAVGVPVITTYVNGIPELAVDHQSALVVPAGNVDALADAIATMLDDASLRAALVSDAARRVRDGHELHTNTKQLAALFETVVDHGR